jgi:outer membrane receptor protein involved in Fe transport
MKLNPEGRLKRAIQLAFIGGTVSTAMIPVGQAYAQDSGKAVELQGVQVTGSLIRRVDVENSNPITVVDRKAIEASGVTTIGQLLQQLPTVTGDALTPQVNNGGSGDGASTISLRGLGDVRTLILVDGKRTLSNDVNKIPVSMIERVEVLNEGAGTVYGSDAIGGVVNFITRRTFTGTELTASSGVATDSGDARKQSVSLTTGLSTKDSHGVIGFSYDKSGVILGSNRPNTNNFNSLLYGQIYQNGSSRIPTGLFTQSTPFTDSSGRKCTTVTRVPGAVGNSFDTSNFECRGSLPTNLQSYNYQVENFVYTPTDRIHFFALGDTAITDNIKAYAKGYYTHVAGHNQLASEAFDTTTLTDAQGNPLNVQISQYSQYNPFGSDVTAFKLRAVNTGDRSSQASENNLQGTVGLKTTLFDRFDWDTSYSLGLEDDSFQNTGYLNISQLAQQLGPSQNGVCYGSATPGANGGPTVYSNPISNCTPINFIGTNGTNYAALSFPVVSHDFSTLQTVNSNIAGDLFTLPAGAVSAAVGVEYRLIHDVYTPDSAAQAFQLSEANGLGSGGGYSVREAYGEVLIPILKDLPFIKQLNVDLGTRVSSYSNFGETTNNKYALEYRPFRDLLLRATYQDVFRAPTIGDLFGAASNDAPSYSDPCNGFTGGATSQYPNLPAACKNVPTNGQFVQGNTQGAAISKGNPNVGPEKGYTTDYGLVYSPSWYKPLTVTTDLWIYSIKDAIALLDQNTAVQACAISGSANYCNKFSRGADGQIFTGLEDPENIGHFYTRGLDIGLNLNYPRTAFGSFTFAMNGTYLGKFDQKIANVSEYSTAGEVSGSFVGGGYPRFKMNSSLDWSLGNVDVVLRNRFIASERDDGGQDGQGHILGVDLASAGNNGNAAGLVDCSGPNATGTVAPLPGQSGPTVCTRDAGYRDYQDIAITYKAKPIKTDFTIGMYDIFDQRAPTTYVSTSSFNYDASNYDNTGRYLYGRVRIYLPK